MTRPDPPIVADPLNEPAPAPGRIAPPIVPALASGLLLYFAYPPADRGYLAWFALVPLLTLLRRDGKRSSIYLGAWAGGLAFWLLSLLWIWELHPGAWVAWLTLGMYQSIYWPLFVLLARVMTRRQGLPTMLAAPIAWVGLEYVQEYAFSGFPWYYLAHSQHAYLPLIQISDLGGAWLLSALVMLGNAWLADLLGRPLFEPSSRGPRLSRRLIARTAVLVVLLASSLGYGVYRLRAEFRPGPTVALLQSDIGQEMKLAADPTEILRVFADLIAEAGKRAGLGGLDLIVWPETSFPGGHVRIDPSLSEADIERHGAEFFPDATAAEWFERRERVREDFRRWSKAVGAPMLVGTILYDLGPTGGTKSNAAYVFGPEGELESSYRKMHLVPFGEYVPLLETFPAIARLTPYEPGHLPGLAAGEGPAWFDVGRYRYAPLICFENTIPGLVGRLYRQAPAGRKPEVLVDISNDGWFGGSAEHDMHLAIAAFRSVEHRTPTVRAVNRGISAVIDGNGRVVRSLPKLTAGVIVEPVPLDGRRALYSRIGDVFAQGCFAASVGLMALALLGFPRRNRPSPA